MCTNLVAMTTEVAPGGDTFDTKFLFADFEEAEVPENNEALNAFRKAKKVRKEKKAPKADYNVNRNDANSPAAVNSAQARYISELEQQNAKLKAIIKRMFGPQAFKEDKSRRAADAPEQEINLLEQLEEEIQSTPFAIVLYLNNDISNAHRKEVHEIMRGVSERKATQDVLMTKKFVAQNSAVPLKSFTALPSGKRSNSTINVATSKQTEEAHIIAACQYFKSFFLDRMGCPLLEGKPGSTDIWDIPSYQQKFFKALPFVEETLNVMVKQRKQCFNCGGEHFLPDCPEPKDQKRIAQARQESQSKQKQKPAFQKMNDEANEKFKIYKPGQISVGLEEALGISLKEQLPPYIYKMRLIGYPPGWLVPEDAGLKMYAGDGLLMEEPGAEEGEIQPPALPILPPVINYPGFNAALPEGVPDEARKLGMTPFQPEKADLDIAMKRAQVLGHRASEPLAKRLRYDDDEPADMDIDDSEEANAGDTPPLPLIETSDEIYKPPQPNTDDTPPMPPADDAVEGAKPPEPTAEAAAKKLSKKQAKPPVIDDSTYRGWYTHEPLTSIGITYFMYTPPPTVIQPVVLTALPKLASTTLDREPWKTASASWYDPLYGDLSAPTGTFDAIRGLLKDNVLSKRKRKSFVGVTPSPQA